MNKINAEFDAGDAVTAMPNQNDDNPDQETSTATGTSLVPVRPTALSGVEHDSRDEVWSILQKAVQTDAEVPRIWRRRRVADARATAVQAFDHLRTQLLQAVRSDDLRRIAVAAPFAGNGTTFVSVNLARSLSRVPGIKSILLDLNLRDPGVADMIGVETEGDMDEFLTGEVSFFEHLVRYNEGLALGVSEGARPNASDLLQSAIVAGTFKDMEQILRPDVVLLDLPPILEYDDLNAMLPHIDGVLLVSDGTSTQAKHIEECERLIKKRSKLLGVVLNRARN